MPSVGVALFFVSVVAVANFLLGYAVAAKLGFGPKDWESICDALKPVPIDAADPDFPGAEEMSDSLMNGIDHSVPSQPNKS